MKKTILLLALFMTTNLVINAQEIGLQLYSVRNQTKTDIEGTLKKIRAMAIDMETATIFTVGFANHIPTGALLLVSDQPMTPEGVKTDKSDTAVTSKFVDNHLKIGIESLKQLINNGDTVKHLRY